MSLGVRRRAAMALGEIGDSRAVGPLVATLKNEDGYVRAEAAKALGKTGDKRAVNPLVQNLMDWYSNRSVAEALSQLAWKPQSDNDKIHFG